MSELRLNDIACADALTWCRELPDASVDVWWSSPGMREQAEWQ